MKLSWIFEFKECHVEELLSFYAQESWTTGRSDELVRKLISGSDLVIGCCIDKELIGFARVLTDFALKAMIYDVIVRANYRGHKIGDAIIEQIITHPRLTEVQHFELYCPDHLAGYYERHNFEINTSRLLRRHCSQ